MALNFYLKSDQQSTLLSLQTLTCIAVTLLRKHGFSQSQYRLLNTRTLNRVCVQSCRVVIAACERREGACVGVGGRVDVVAPACVSVPLDV